MIYTITVTDREIPDAMRQTLSGLSPEEQLTYFSLSAYRASFETTPLGDLEERGSIRLWGPSALDPKTSDHVLAMLLCDGIVVGLRMGLVCDGYTDKNADVYFDGGPCKLLRWGPHHLEGIHHGYFETHFAKYLFLYRPDPFMDPADVDTVVCLSKKKK